MRPYRLPWLLLAALVAPALWAQDEYPSRPVTIVVPFPPGGIADDLTAHPFAPALERVLKQPVLVQNRPGAAGATDAQFVANAAPDGYTLLVALVSISSTPEVDKLFGRTPIYTRDQFVGIARLNADPPVLVVHPSIPARNLKEFVALAKARPNEMIFSSSGPYGASHLPYAMLLHAAGLKMRHLPTTGGGPAMTAVLGGHAVTGASPPGIASPHLKAGEVKGLATRGAQRLAEFPAIPTLKEYGYDVEYYLWTGFFAPRAIPAGAFATLCEATRQAVKDPDFVRSMEEIQTPVAYQHAEEFKAWWDQDAEKIAAVIRRIGKVAEK